MNFISIAVFCKWDKYHAVTLAETLRITIVEGQKSAVQVRVSLFSQHGLFSKIILHFVQKRTYCKIHKFHKLDVEVIKCMDSKFVKACKTYAADITFGWKRILKEKRLFK